MIRLVCIDVDGTLVGSEGTVPDDAWAAAEQARARGIRLAICSGRPAFGTTGEYAARLDADGWHIFQNGASTVHLPTGRSLSTPLPAHLVDELVTRARRTGRILELYSDGAYAVERDSERAREHARLLGVPFAPRAFESLPGPIVRGQWLLPVEELERVRAEPHGGLEVNPSTSPVMPGTAFVNLTLAGVDKASAVRAVARAYGLRLEDVMMVGDGLNDAAAMRVVGHAVAMGNAEPPLLDSADHVVAHVDEGGLAEALAIALAGA